MQAADRFLRKPTFGSLLMVLVVMALTLAPALFGQAYFGTVSGELTDGTGAVVTGAKVVLTDQQKGFHFETISDNGGRYLFRSIPPGVYVVSVQASGFGKTASAGFKVDINENATANLVLKVAAATQTVEVEAAAQTIQTEDAETGQVVNRRFINNLPLIDRNIESLTSLAPGVTEMDDQCPEPCLGTNFVSNGSRGASADILLDGASVTNSEPNGGITSVTYLPSPEAVEEFKVEQTNFSAEYGFSGASVVNVIGRSGTNKCHGSVYEFFRDGSLDANDWFANRAGEPIPPLRRHNYGGTIGGPIFKNKTFFFFDYDGTRETGLSTAAGAVPSDAMRGGDFGEVCVANGGVFNGAGRCSADAGQIWDPYSGTFNGTITRSTFIPFNNLATYTSPGPANQVPGNLIDPVAQKMMSYFPEPNFVSGGIYQNWVGSGSSKSSDKQFDIRIDHRFTENDLITGKVFL